MSRSRGGGQHRQSPARTDTSQPATPPGEVPPGLTRDPALHSAGSPQDEARLQEQAVQALLAEGRFEDAAQLRAQQQQAAARAGELARIRDLLVKDPALLVYDLMQQAGPLIAQVVQAVVTEALAAQPRTGKVCTHCFAGRVAWNTMHKPDLEKAQEQAMAVLGVTDPADPRMAQVDLTPYLPGHLQPGGGPLALPVVFDAITTVNGAEVCPQHHPAVPQQGGRLLSVSGLNVHQAAQFAMAGMPGGMG